LAQTQSSTADAIGGLFWGPRFGITYLSQPVQNELDRRNLETAPVISQVGWSWEQRFVVSPESPMAMTQFVLLVGGSEQGVFLPSITWLIGMRGIGGAEAGFGPNVSLGGASMAVALGITKRVGALNVPFDVALVFGRPGLRVSFLTGFNMRREAETKDSFYRSPTRRLSTHSAQSSTMTIA
jgi:hypothetical protein